MGLPEQHKKCSGVAEQIKMSKASTGPQNFRFEYNCAFVRCNTLIPRDHRHRPFGIADSAVPGAAYYEASSSNVVTDSSIFGPTLCRRGAGLTLSDAT